MAAGSFGSALHWCPVQRAVLGPGYGRSDQASSSACRPSSTRTSIRTVKVEFLADIASAGNWESAPWCATLDVHPGQLYTAQLSTRTTSAGVTPWRRRCPTSPIGGGRVLPQDRMLLLSRPSTSAQRGARPAGALLHRSGAAAPHRSDHTGVHVLRRFLARHPATLGTRDSRQESSWPTHTLRQQPLLHSASQSVADPRLDRAVRHHAGRDRATE